VAEAPPVLELAEAQASGAPDQPLSLRLLPGELLLIDARDAERTAGFADLCCGLSSLQDGEIRFLGRDWTRMPHRYAERLRGRIGRTFATGAWAGMLDMEHNILLPQLHHSSRDQARLREQAAELALFFGLPGLPMGRPRELSAADLARAGCVRAFLGEPALLILESPTQTFADLVPLIISALARARDRGAAALWLTRSDRVWRDHSVPATRRMRLGETGLPAVRHMMEAIAA
jgi:phospholipid/cholesterol/gamma-HCH transport system ATP-binding protein